AFAYGTSRDMGEAEGISNIYAYDAQADEGGFVNGVIAAHLTKSNVIGIVGPVEAGDAKLYIDGFVNGVHSVNPDIDVQIAYTGSFGDTALAAETANTHIAAGADVLTGSAQQVVGAIGVAAEAGIPWLGTQQDQSPIAEDIVVATQQYDWTAMVRTILANMKANKYGGELFELTLENGGLSMQYGNLNQSVIDAAEAAISAIKAGDFDPSDAAGTMGVMAGDAMMDDGGDDAMMMETPEIEPVRIAIVMPSGISDLAWSQSIYESLLSVQAMYDPDVVEIAYTEGMFNVSDAATALRDYASEGFDVVIAHGTQYGTSLFEIAPDFPETAFLYGTSRDTGEAEGLTNVSAYDAQADEGGYVNGVIAANLSESGVIGIVAPIEAGDAKLYIDGFVAGVESVDADAEVLIVYTGSFGDIALAAETANTHIAAGADVLTGSAQQVVGAIGVAKEQGIPWVGTQYDQSTVAPDNVVATQLYDWSAMLLDVIVNSQSGTYGGSVYELTLANHGLTMVYGDALSAEVIAAADAAVDGIVSGEITPR
ncbi:MAG TPA: BMP family ABC transporter substrate-binding protein, partial [Anaerolineae bacterium]|nr:BMP family ABC transporter substrate-binding protein [Anaerolineae bacterium]